jgi:hypothetical protein
MPTVEQQGVNIRITPQDLQDPELFQLNYVLNFLAQQIASVQGGTGPITLGNTVTAPDFFSEDDSVPTNPLALLTLIAAQKLFGSSNQLVNTALSQNPVPFPSGGSGGGGGGGSGSLTLQEIALSHSSTTNIVASISPTVAALLLIVLTCDGTDGDQITWDSHLKNTSVNDIGNAANQKNFYLFVGRSDGNWWKFATQLGV